jgi:hypothetical protein
MSFNTQIIRWRPLEAALAAVGSQAEAVLDCVQDEQDSGRAKPIDIEHLLANVIPNILGLSRRLPCLMSAPIESDVVVDQPFLQGRGFVFASQFAQLLPLQSSGQYLEAGLQVIESSGAGIPVKISAIKAVHKSVAYFRILSV